MAPISAAISYPIGIDTPQRDQAADEWCADNHVPPPGMFAVEAGAAVFYIDARGTLPVASGNGWWIYQESNGVYHDPYYGDLQRGGSSQIVPDDNEICVDGSPAGAD